MKEELIRKVVDKIEAAFENTPYPGDKYVGDDVEVSSFIGKKWQEVTEADIISVNYLHFFSDKGRRYYLPAYLIAAFHYPKLRSRIVEAVIRHLAPFPDSDWRNKDVRIYAIFSPAERAAIRYFFESYEQLFPFPTGENMTLTAQSILEEDQQALKTAVEYWQHYG